MNAGTTKKARIAFALSLGTALTIAFWLLHGEGSPLHEFAIWNPTIGNALLFLSFPAYLVGALASGNVHQPSEGVFYAAIFIQWASLGYLTALFFLLSKRPEREGR